MAFKIVAQPGKITNQKAYLKGKFKSIQAYKDKKEQDKKN